MRRAIPSTQALACFEAAARHESYTRAAQELALTQGAVSRQVIALEEFVGVALFRRTRHGVALTSAGEAYARKVRGWLLENKDIEIGAGTGPYASKIWRIGLMGPNATIEKADFLFDAIVEAVESV